MADLKMLEWLQIGATEHLLGVFDTSVVDFLGGSPGSQVPNGTARLPGSGSADANGAWIEGHFVIGNGVNQNLRYNGASVGTAIAQQMVAAVTVAPTVVTDVGGADTHPADTFEYRISFLNADGKYGEAGPSVSTGAIIQAFDSSVQNIPQPAVGQDASNIRIWRRSGGNSVYKKVADVAIGTTTFFDNVLNANLGETLVDLQTRFPPARYFDAWGTRLVGAFCTVTAEGDKQTVFISNEEQHYYSPLSPDTTIPTQGGRVRLEGRAAGEITGLRTHGGLVAVFTSGTGWLLRGDQPLNFNLQRFTNHGCVAHRTIISARDLLIWLSNDGVYAFNGQQVQRISDDVRTTLDAMTSSERAGAHAVLFQDRYYLFWATGALYFDLQYRTWGSLSNNLWRDAAASDFVSSGVARLWGAKEGSGSVYQLETGATDAIPSAGTTITATWASRDWDMGLPGRDKRVAYVETKFRKATGTATVTLFRGTGESIQVLSHDVSSVDNAADTVSRKLQGAKEEARDEHFRVKVEIATTDAVCELLAAGLMYSVAS